MVKIQVILILISSYLKKKSDSDKLNCEKEISIGECTSAVKELKRGKTPGSDGLTSDFYQFFWEDIKIIVFNSLIYL